MSIDETLLLECLASPWSSSFQLAMRAGIASSDADAACKRLCLAGFLQRIEQHLAYLPSVLYAPMPAALEWVAKHWGVTPALVARKARLTETRYRWLRESIDIAQEANGLCSVLAQAKPDWHVTWETGIVRTYRGLPLILHGRLSLQASAATGEAKHGTFYLLMDRGQQKVLGWWRMLRYLSVASRRDANVNGHRAGTCFPTILIITTHAYRAASLLRLAHKFNTRASVAASWDRATIFGVGAHATEWFTLLRIEPHRVLLKSLQPFAPDQLGAGLPKHWPFCMARPRKATKITQPVPVLHIQTSWGTAAAAMESLDDTCMKTLIVLCRHPLCPETTLQTFSGCSSQEARVILQALCDKGLATNETIMLPIARNLIGDQQISLPDGQKHLVRLLSRHDSASTERRIADAVREGAHLIAAQVNGDGTPDASSPLALPLADFWQATPAAVYLRACREGRNTDAYAKAYAALCRERKARPYHALAVYDFFERLQKDCERYAAATRKMTGVDADYYELIVFEDELQARASFMHEGRRRYWCPDGYGVVRCGERCTPFWLEIDGTLHTRARPDVGVWTQKFDALCAYFCSGEWTRIHPEFPTLFVVTVQASIKGRLREVLEKTSNAHGIAAPAVFLVSREAWLQRGPLAPIWMNLVHTHPSLELDYAFAGAQQPGVLNAPAHKEVTSSHTTGEIY
jgi:hypothetical protein